jgi:hypothetical protein
MKYRSSSFWSIQGSLARRARQDRLELNARRAGLGSAGISAKTQRAVIGPGTDGSRCWCLPRHGFGVMSNRPPRVPVVRGAPFAFGPSKKPAPGFSSRCLLLSLKIGSVLKLRSGHSPTAPSNPRGIDHRSVPFLPYVGSRRNPAGPGRFHLRDLRPRGGLHRPFPVQSMASVSCWVPDFGLPSNVFQSARPKNGFP